MGGKGRKRRENNYKVTHCGVVVLPQMSKSSQLEVLPFKLRQIIYFIKIKMVFSFSISPSIIYVKFYIFLVYQFIFIQKYISFFFCISFEELKPLDLQVLLVHRCFVFINIPPLSPNSRGFCKLWWLTSTWGFLGQPLWKINFNFFRWIDLIHFIFWVYFSNLFWSDFLFYSRYFAI